MILVQEVWKTYPHNDNYEISDKGKVRRAKDSARGHKHGTLLRPGMASCGYYTVSLCENGKHKTSRIHKLVLETFVGNRPEGMECNHRDGIKTNNKLSNLEWISPSESSKHAFKLGLSVSPKGEKHGQAKLTENDVIKIRKLYQNGWKQGDIAKKFNIHRAHVSNIVHKHWWKHV